MTVSITYPLSADPAPLPATPTADATPTLANASPTVTGRGLLLPFRRNQRDDFANGTGRELWQSRVELLLSVDGPTETSTGEIAWRPDEGTAIRLLRHKNNTSILRSMAEAYIRQGFQRSFRGKLKLNRVTKFTKESNKVVMEVAFDVIAPNAPVVRNVTAEVTLPVTG